MHRSCPIQIVLRECSELSTYLLVIFNVKFACVVSKLRYRGDVSSSKSFQRIKVVIGSRYQEAGCFFQSMFHWAKILEN